MSIRDVKGHTRLRVGFVSIESDPACFFAGALAIVTNPILIATGRIVDGECVIEWFSQHADCRRDRWERS